MTFTATQVDAGRSAHRKGKILSSIPEFDEKQLAAARANAWHQDGIQLRAAEDARAWIGNFGLVLFAPRPLQLPIPAPSLVEAMQGRASVDTGAAELQTAVQLVGRLVADGSVLPLNLMGVVSDTPDFLVSAQVFSFIFTLRGDKLWKQPPSTTGAVKVSPLGLKAYQVLAEKGPLTAAQLASEMGREVTEAATLRVLTELWSQLRVIPLPQPEDQPTQWELTTKRFTKAIKAGANAGQPKALSTLISLYLAQAIAATEDEITTFLSPLTARSRLREVLHVLTGARQLDTIAVEGKTLLHIPGALNEHATSAQEPTTEETVAQSEVAVSQRPKKIGTGRIGTFGGGRKPIAAYRGKPESSFGEAPRRLTAGSKGTFRPVTRADGKIDRERRPFKKNDSQVKPSFSKPWNEARKTGHARLGGPAKSDSFSRFRKSAPGDREPLGPREQAGLPQEKRIYPKASFDRGNKPGGFTKRPFTPRTGKGESPRLGSFNREAKPPYTPRPAQDGGRSLPKRPYKPRAADADKRPFTKAPWVPKAEEGQGGTFKPRKPSGTYDRGGNGPRKGYSSKSGAKFGDTKTASQRFGAKKFQRAAGGKPPARGLSEKRVGSAPNARPNAITKPEHEE